MVSIPRLEPDWAGYDKTCIEFLTSQKKGTLHTYKCFLRLALRFANMSGLEMLESKKADKTFEWERRAIQFKQWIKTQKTQRGDSYGDHAAETATNTLRSFFEYYREPLRFSQTENRKMNSRSQRKTQDYRLENDDIIKMLFVADLREKYILLLGKSVGLRVGDFVKFTFGTFRSLNLSQDPPIFMGEIQTVKEGVLAYPFIDADALPIVKKILETNKDKGDNERLVTVQEEELTTILQQLAAKAGIVLGGKRLRFHCLRKYLIDRLANNMSESKWKQIVGKAISEDAYVSEFELKSCYVNAMKWTTVTSGVVAGLTKEDLENVKELASNLPLYKELYELLKAKKLVHVDDPELAKRFKIIEKS